MEREVKGKKEKERRWERKGRLTRKEGKGGKRRLMDRERGEKKEKARGKRKKGEK